jgi:hypothetical protein
VIPARRFPAPWVTEEDKDCFRVKDASGFMIRVVLHREDLQNRGYQYASASMTRDEARRIAKAAARLPEILKKEPAFVARKQSDMALLAVVPQRRRLQIMMTLIPTMGPSMRA